MTDALPPCPKCNSPYSYEDGLLLVCPECGHEWSVLRSLGEAGSAEGGSDSEEAGGRVWKDSVGNILADGDSVTVIKDLKFRGGVVKVGTKVKGIRLVEGDHDIDCKVPGIGQMGLKTEFVKKIVE